jgi:osmoprotectant transport system permease protein
MGSGSIDDMTFIGQVIRWFVDGAHWQGDGGIPHRLAEHVAMSGASLLAAALIALPIGIILGHFGRGGNLAINISNVGRAIPSFALLVIAVELVGIGAVPAFVALLALGVPPIVTNSYIGMREVNADVREAARGMGMRGRMVLWRIELPIALPFIMAGIRTSAVNIVATATLAALVAWGGLGRFIVDGLGQQDYPMLYAGAILVALLSLIVEFSLAGVQRMVTPQGLRVSRTTADLDSKKATTLATA